MLDTSTLCHIWKVQHSSQEQDPQPRHLTTKTRATSPMRSSRSHKYTVSLNSCIDSIYSRGKNVDHFRVFPHVSVENADSTSKLPSLLEHQLKCLYSYV